MWKEKIERAMVSGEFFQRSWRFIKKRLKNISPNTIIMNLSRRWICIRTPVNDKKVFFQTFQGDYTCNPKYITEELLRRDLDVEIVWSLRKGSLMKSYSLPSKIHFVEQFSYEYFKEIASSKIWVENSVEFLKKKIIKKKNQILIETWHGALGIKRFSRDVNSGKAWVKAADRCAKYSNYVVSNSDFEDDVFRGSFWDKTPILRYGHARNDILIQNDPDKAEKIRQVLLRDYKIPIENKLVLYAPTFRDSHKFDYYMIDGNALLTALSERFGGEWTLMTRYHPTVRAMAKKNASKFKRKETDVTNYPDIQELMIVSDVAITDYSSWIYDFVLTHKPGFIYATDIQSYYSERGFYYPLESTPFPIATNNDELISNIKNFDANEYEQKVNTFLDDKGCIEDGHAAERIVDKIVELLEEG